MLSDLTNRTSVDSTAPALSSETLENDLDLPSPCFPSNGSSCFKENININKAVTSKLSVEPQQMKRKKQGGGYNLRKSLAWDRAFFTEEGVLDPLELSVISGASCSKGVPSINEKTPGDSKLSIKQVDVQKIESSLLKELQFEDIVKDRKKDWSSPKTSHKVLARLGCRSGSRCNNLPRHLPSSSLKRPANITVGKAAGKESKLPKVPDSKPGPRPATTKSTILKANCVKHNQITRPPDLNFQKNAGLTSSCRSIKNTQNMSKVISLPSACCSDGNSGNSSSKRHSSDNMIPDRPVHSSDGHNESRSSAALYSRDAHVSCSTIHTSQNQMMKPSGLRMPSPSLSFFAQPKPSIFRDLSMGDAKTDACWSQKPGNTMLRDNLGRTSKADDKIPESTIGSSKAISSKSGYIVPSHAYAVELIKSNLDQNPMQKVEVKVQDLLRKNSIESISTEAELQKIDIEEHSQNSSHEQAIDDNTFKKAINGYLVKNESFGSQWKNPDLKSGQNFAVHECETTISSADDRPKEKSTCNLLVLNHGSINRTQCEDALNHEVKNSLTVRSDWKETCRPDCHDLHRDQTDPYEYSLGENDMMTDEDKNVSETKERTGLQRAVSEQIGCWCGESVSCEVLEHRQTEAEISHVGPKHLCVDLSKQAVFTDVLTDDLLVGEAHMQNAVASTIRGTDFHDTEQSVKGSVAQISCPKAEIELQIKVQLRTSGSLLPAKQVCLQSSQQENNVENLLSVVSDRKDGNEVIDSKLASSLSPGKMPNCNLDNDTDNLIGQPLINKECGSVDSSVSSKIHDNLINTRISYDEESRFNQDSWRIESDYCSSLPESRTSEMSQISTLSKVAEVESIDYGSAIKRSMSITSLKGSESDMDNLRNACHSRAMLMQSPERSMADECCFQPAESALPSAEFVHSNDELHIECHPQTENHPDVPFEDNTLGSMEDSVSKGSMEDSVSEEKKITMLVSSNVSAEESTLEHESCNDADETGGYIADAITGPSRVAPVSDTTTIEFSEGIPNSDLIKVEASSAPNNKNEDTYGKSHSFFPPHNVIPFSDEWLAAIEAAGEDILTRKGGAVQNSPPDKSLPEPSPWSPVRRKNNQIGPYDCTKFTNIVPSDSN